MKKYFFLAAMLLVGAMGFVACSDDDNEKEGEEDEVQSALVCVEQIIDGCMDIANEVGNA